MSIPKKLYSSSNSATDHAKTPTKTNKTSKKNTIQKNTKNSSKVKKVTKTTATTKTATTTLKKKKSTTTKKTTTKEPTSKSGSITSPPPPSPSSPSSQPSSPTPLSPKRAKKQKRVMTPEELTLFVRLVRDYEENDLKIPWTKINREYFQGKFNANFLHQKYKRTVLPNEHKYQWTPDSELDLLLLVQKYTDEDEGVIAWTKMLENEGFDRWKLSTTQLNNKYKSLIGHGALHELKRRDMSLEERRQLMRTQKQRRTTSSSSAASRQQMSLKRPRTSSGSGTVSKCLTFDSDDDDDKEGEETSEQAVDKGDVDEKETKSTTAKKGQRTRSSKSTTISKQTRSKALKSRRRTSRVVDDDDSDETDEDDDSDYEVEAKEQRAKRARSNSHGVKKDNGPTPPTSKKVKRVSSPSTPAPLAATTSRSSSFGLKSLLTQDTNCCIEETPTPRRVTRSQVAMKTRPTAFAFTQKYQASHSNIDSDSDTELSSDEEEHNHVDDDGDDDYEDDEGNQSQEEEEDEEISDVKHDDAKKNGDAPSVVIKEKKREPHVVVEVNAVPPVMANMTEMRDDDDDDDDKELFIYQDSPRLSHTLPNLEVARDTTIRSGSDQLCDDDDGVGGISVVGSDAVERGVPLHEGHFVGGDDDCVVGGCGGVVGHDIMCENDDGMLSTVMGDNVPEPEVIMMSASITAIGSSDIHQHHQPADDHRQLKLDQPSPRFTPPSSSSSTSLPPSSSSCLLSSDDDVLPLPDDETESGATGVEADTEVESSFSQEFFESEGDLIKDGMERALKTTETPEVVVVATAVERHLFFNDDDDDDHVANSHGQLPFGGQHNSKELLFDGQVEAAEVEWNEREFSSTSSEPLFQF